MSVLWLSEIVTCLLVHYKEMTELLLHYYVIITVIPLQMVSDHMDKLNTSNLFIVGKDRVATWAWCWVEIGYFEQTFPTSLHLSTLVRNFVGEHNLDVIWERRRLCARGPLRGWAFSFREEEQYSAPVCWCSNMPGLSRRRSFASCDSP